jgi:NADH dehydrogenase [ubiquinone] 1 alpha subcomplex assembly factor 1
MGVFGDGAATVHYLDELGKIMIQQMLVLSWLILMGSFVMAEEKLITLFEFVGADVAKEWQAVNDGVMGGVSEGKFKITDNKTLEFFGRLSLENNGGFASVRTKAKKLGLERGDILVVKVRGDGREYMLNLYPNRQRMAYSYRVPMPTKQDEWIEVRVPLDMFEATSFGRPVKGAGTVDPKEISSLGFMMSDKNTGPFQLEVESIQVERESK